MDKELQEKVCIVTGGSSGIGKAITSAFAREGGKVYILDTNEEQGQNCVTELKQEGGQVVFKKCDVSDHAESARVIDSVASENSKIDILVNNAGIAHIGTVESTTEADFDKVYRVNVKGIFNCSQAVIPHFKNNNGGVILNMASIASTVGIPDRFAYSMSKGAVLTMTLSMARDYVDQNIRCNCISPARVYTPFVEGFLKDNYPGREKEMYEKLSQTQPIGRMGKPGEIAELAVYLCSDKAGFVTGSNYPIDGGFLNLNT